MGKMKVLIPMSGGFDSTYLLWKTLEETDHEVHVIHVELDTSSRRVIPENRASVAIEKWMKNNCRPIESWVNGSVTIDWQSDGLLDYVLLAPVILSRVMGIMDVDEIWFGAHTEEYELYELNGFSGGYDWPWMDNFIDMTWHHGCAYCPEGEPYKGRDIIRLVHPYRDVRKKVAMAEMPKELFDLSWSCHYPDTETLPGETEVHYSPCEHCSSCLFRAGKSAEEVFNITVDNLNSDQDIVYM